MQLQVRRGLLSVHLWVSEWVHAFTCWLFCQNCTIRCCHPLSLDWVPELGAAPWALNELHLAMRSSIETPLVAMRQTSINLCVCTRVHGGLADCTPVLWRRWGEEKRKREGKQGRNERGRAREEKEKEGGCILLSGLFVVRLLNTLVLFCCQLFESQSIVWFLGHEIWAVCLQKTEIQWSTRAAH